MMKKQPYLPSTKRKVIKWGSIALLILFLFIAIAFIYIYQVAMDDKEETFSTSKQKTIQNTPIESVDEVVRYNGEKSYDVVFGQSEDDSKGIAFVPILKDEAKDENQEKITYVKESDGVTEEEVTSSWRSNCPSCELISVTPGIDNGHIIWEIVYRNEDERYVFESYLFKSGELYEQFKFRK
ncbi:hypothetical protein GH754_18640 [Salinibacillus xinjiangensis]|uniref:Cell wall elongation regulator TseB-like domain-containing protein n=2 Tax=Salinibacillus xinjiangensis TaxID=1229268 RepID=A0A6G1XBG0_9BACI|nr:hypothetical protein [Salinibacillus xinjiangensis]